MMFAVETKSVWTRTAATIAGLLVATLPAHAEWAPSSFDGEGQRAALGCSVQDFDDAWLCMVVRCEASKELALYLDLTNLDIDDAFTLIVDGRRFPVEGSLKVGDAPYSSRLSGDITSIVDALKTGREVVLDRPQHPFTPGFDTIPLNGSSNAISAVEEVCKAKKKKSNGTRADGPQMLPLKPGIYVRADSSCSTGNHATTMSYRGEELNSQRVVGTISSVTHDAGSYQVSIDAYDIAEEESIGTFDWTLYIPDQHTFSYELGNPEETYRWCE